MNREQAMNKIREEFEKIPASAVADLLLSPHISAQLIRESTVEPGPSLWMVNRSDVYDATLSALSEHVLTDIAERARAKLNQRRSKIHNIAPPMVEQPFDEIEDYAIEDLIGHPLAPFDAMLHFSRSTAEDVRASCALSLTRRTLEYPPEWITGDPTRESLLDRFGSLLRDDPAPFVRAYCSRIPFLPSEILGKALEVERHPFVMGKILQNPNTNRAQLEFAIERVSRSTELRDPFVGRVLALDERLSSTQRRKVQELIRDPLCEAIQDWYLAPS